MVLKSQQENVGFSLSMFQGQAMILGSWLCTLHS